MNKILIALVLAVGLIGNIFAESSIKNDFVYVNEANCNSVKNRVKNQKFITDALFGNVIATKMGCNKKSGYKAYDVPLICKYPKNIKNIDQRCFGLSIESKFEEGKSIYSPRYGREPQIHVPSSSKKIVDGKIIYYSYGFCAYAPLHIEEDWFYVIQDLMIQNGWKIDSENKFRALS